MKQERGRDGRELRARQVEGEREKGGQGERESEELLLEPFYVRDSGREGEEKAATFKFDSKGGKIGMGSKASKISNAKGDKKPRTKQG